MEIFCRRRLLRYADSTAIPVTSSKKKGGRRPYSNGRHLRTSPIRRGAEDPGYEPEELDVAHHRVAQKRRSGPNMELRIPARATSSR